MNNYSIFDNHLNSKKSSEFLEEKQGLTIRDTFTNNLNSFKNLLSTLNENLQRPEIYRGNPRDPSKNLRPKTLNPKARKSSTRVVGTKVRSDISIEQSNKS